MNRSLIFFFIISSFFVPVISCHSTSTSAEMVFEIPVPPESKFFKEARKGRIKIYKTTLSQKEVVDFYKNYFKEEDATFFKKKDSEIIMVAGNLLRTIEIITKKKEVFISFSKFEI